MPEVGTYSYKYPHAALTTDSVVFGFDGRELHVLLIERGMAPFKGDWALPGGFMKMDETVEECARRELFEETGVKEIYLEQFKVFSAVHRDPRERVVTVAFLALVRKSDYRLVAGDDASRASWFEMKKLPPLAFDHLEIVHDAKEKLQEILHTRPVAFRLLDKQFTMSELQSIYEAIYETNYDRRNFQRQVMATGLVQSVGALPEPTGHRKPQLFAFDEKNVDYDQASEGSLRNLFRFKKGKM